MKSVKGLMRMIVLALVIGSLAACATGKSGEGAYSSGDTSTTVVNKIEEWKPVWNNDKEDIRKKYFDSPEFFGGIRTPMSSKGNRFYIDLKENNRTLGSLGIGENYSIFKSFSIDSDNPLKFFIKEKFAAYCSKSKLQEDSSTYKEFLKYPVIITVTAEFKPWNISYEDKWKPHAKIVASDGKKGAWNNISSKVQERVYQIAKSMYISGYIDDLKRKNPNPNKMDIAMEGRHILVYGLPGDDTCYEIKTRPSEILDKYLDKIKK